MYYTVYKTTNRINGKIYIGSHKTKNPNDGYLGSGKYLKYAIEKYGRENFIKEVLFIFDNSADMYAKEAEIVSVDFITETNTYNLKQGGFGGFDYLNSDKFDNPTHSTEHLKKMRLAYDEKIKTNPAWLDASRRRMHLQGIKSRDEQLGMFDPANKHLRRVGHKRSEETKAKIREKAKVRTAGKGNSQYGTMWITDGIINKKMPADSEIPAGWRKGRVSAFNKHVPINASVLKVDII